MDRKSRIQPKPAQRSALAAWYRSVLELAAEGGVSIGEVALQMGCSAAVLYAWRRKLGLDVDRAAKQPSGPQPTGPLRLKVAPTDRSSIEDRFEVRCQGGGGPVHPRRERQGHRRRPQGLPRGRTLPRQPDPTVEGPRAHTVAPHHRPARLRAAGKLGTPPVRATASARRRRSHSLIATLYRTVTYGDL